MSRLPLDEAKELGRGICDQYENENVKGGVIDLMMQM
jgi:hypothetical protein